ncbi:MAG TPA: T9SS type A sorting domain-containing protein [Flavobacteriales bacterium]
MIMSIAKHLGLCLPLVLVIGAARAQNINGYRYWIDNDLAAITTNDIAPVPSLTLNTPLPVDALSIGHHRISLQFRDTNGAWSTPTEHYFTKSGADLNAWQYWFDTDVAGRVDVNVTADDAVNVVTDIDASALPDGPHTLLWRMKDAMGNWSVPVVRNFDLITAIGELPGVERALLFPNPATHNTTLRLDANTAQDLLVSVQDVTGRTVVEARRFAFQGTGLLDLDIAELAVGRYSIVLTSGQQRTQIPLIRN